MKADRSEVDADIEVLDRNMHVATIGPGGKLAIEMRLKSGRGYVSADRNTDEDLPVGYIPIDSVIIPRSRKVNFSVEAARLGQMTDYDKLTIEVWTNGRPSRTRGFHRPKLPKLLKDPHGDLHPALTEELPRIGRGNRPSAP